MSIWFDKLPGGLADAKTPSSFSPSKLREGVKVEREHSRNKSVAKEIAMDHLSEDKKYYKKLDLIEKLPYRELKNKLEKKGGLMIKEAYDAGMEAAFDKVGSTAISRRMASALGGVSGKANATPKSLTREAFKSQGVNSFKNMDRGHVRQLARNGMRFGDESTYHGVLGAIKHELSPAQSGPGFGERITDFKRTNATKKLKGLLSGVQRGS